MSENKHYEWMKNNTLMIGIRIQKSSGIIEPLLKALEDSGKTRNAYIIDAIREKLERDGYLPAKNGITQ